MGVSQDQQGFFSGLCAACRRIGEFVRGADPKQDQQPLPIRTPYRGNGGGMCLGRLSLALHSLQLRGPEGLTKISASPTTPRVEEP